MVREVHHVINVDSQCFRVFFYWKRVVVDFNYRLITDVLTPSFQELWWIYLVKQLSFYSPATSRAPKDTYSCGWLVLPSLALVL